MHSTNRSKFKSQKWKPKKKKPAFSVGLSTDWLKLLTSKLLESSHLILLRPIKAKLSTDIEIVIDLSVILTESFKSVYTICQKKKKKNHSIYYLALLTTRDTWRSQAEQ